MLIGFHWIIEKQTLMKYTLRTKSYINLKPIVQKHNLAMKDVNGVLVSIAQTMSLRNLVIERRSRFSTTHFLRFPFRNGGLRDLQ
jgi:hypothetical protein